MKTTKLTAIYQKEDDIWVAHCPQIEIASQGSSIEEARVNLVEAVNLFWETAPEEERNRRLSGEVFFSSLEVELA